MADAQVRVRLKQDTTTKKVTVEVAVKSNVRLNSWASLDVDADATNLEYRVQAAGEALAIYCCETYSDRHNPVGCGKTAVEALNEIQLKAAEARKSARR